MNDVVGALGAWRGGTIDEGCLWRRLLRYQDWLLPRRPDCDISPFTRFSLPQANLIPDPAGGFRFAIYSDPDAVEAFTGQEYGSDGVAYSNPTGWEVFSADLGGVTSVVVDPESPHALVIPSGEFAPLKALADAMEVEEAWQRLRHGDEEPEDLGLVARFPSYLMAAIESDAGYVRITVPHDDGGQFLPLFTYRDALARGVAEMGASFRGEPFKTIAVSGSRLFPALVQEEGVDGIVFNYLGPAEPAAFRIGILELLLEELARTDDRSPGSGHAPD